MGEDTVRDSSTAVVYDERGEGHFWMYDAVVDYYAAKWGIYALGVYTLLCRRADCNGASFPSFAGIAEKLAISRSSVIRAISVLKAEGAVHVVCQSDTEKGDLPNEYHLRPLAEWKGEAERTGGGSVSQTPGGVSHRHPKEDPSSKESESCAPPVGVTPMLSVPSEVETWFDQTFWPAYPRKDDRKRCREHVLRRKYDKATRERIMRAVEIAKAGRWRESIEQKTLQYVKTPLAFLNGELYDDPGYIGLNSERAAAPVVLTPYIAARPECLERVAPSAEERAAAIAFLRQIKGEGGGNDYGGIAR